jgi:serine/threonine protein phosphatase 1
VFLGDYVDRGPDSAAVIDLLVAGRPRGFARRFLRGNHEQAMLGFMEAPPENRAWVKHGGAETLVSYGVQPPSPVGALDEDLVAAAARLKAVLPPAHLDFLNNLERYVELGGYAFVHAGIDPARPLNEQTDRDLFWIRDPFLTGKRGFSHRIVHGHTPEERPFADLRRVGVDTGAYASGVLSAARFEGEAVSFLSVSSPRVGHFPAPRAQF